MALRPLNDTFLFAFVNETNQGRFIERNRQGFILTNLDYEAQSKFARWGKVLAVGPDITEFKIGDLVLIEPKMWTLGFKHDDINIWKSDLSKVLATGEDESVTYTY